MSKFKHLTDRKKINVKPSLIKVKKITHATTLRKAFQRYKVPNNKLEEMAVMNGMKLNDKLSINTQIKIIEK